MTRPARFKKRSKFNVGPREERTVDGIVFASKREMNRYCELKMLRDNGKIAELEIQPALPIEINGVKVCKYTADFRYVENGEVVFEDSKGMSTAVYKLKKKLVKAVYGIDIRES